MLRFLTAGESHGPLLSAILDGMPAALPLDAESINRELARRQQGYGRGGRMSIEHDQVHLAGGVVAGKTTGAPSRCWLKTAITATGRIKPSRP